MFKISKSNILLTKTSPYKVQQLQRYFDKDNTVVYYANTGKDDRLTKGGTYFKLTPEDQYRPFSQQGYVINVPYISNKINGKQVSGSLVRDIFISKQIQLQDKKKFFQMIYGKFDKSVFNLIMSRIGYIKQSKCIKNDNVLDESLLSIKKSKNTKMLLMAGGISGHCDHPFEDNNLTFNDFKNIIINSLSGKLNIEKQVTMKLDGQNINVSWKNGRLVGARNKGHIKNFGEKALDINGMKSMFQGRGNVRDAFVFAMEDLQSAISKLSNNHRQDIFDNGRYWMALQIIYDKTQNVIPYGRSSLVLHNISEINDKGQIINVRPQKAKGIYNIILTTNQNIQKYFEIQPPIIVNVPKITDFTKKRSYFLNKLKKLQYRFKLKGTDTLQDYHDAYWKQFIISNANKLKYNIPKSVLQGLIQRWSRLDKKYSINQFKKDCDHTQFLNWASSFNKVDHFSTFKQNIKDWEQLYLQLGVEVLYNLSEYMVANPQASVQKIRKAVLDIQTQIQNSNDIDKMKKMQMLLKRIDSIGGLQKLVPTQGIVFTYKGNIYKLTGLFAPINNLIGMIKYSR